MPVEFNSVKTMRMEHASRDARHDHIKCPDRAPAPLMRLFSGRHEFPDECYRFLRPTDQNATKQTMTLDLSLERFPYLFRGRTLTISTVDVFLTFKDSSNNDAYRPNPLSMTVTLSTLGGETSSSDKLESTLSLFGGTPHKRFTYGVDLSQPAKLAIEAAGVDIAKADSISQPNPTNDPEHTRLRADVIDDLFFVVHYSVSNAQ